MNHYEAKLEEKRDRLERAAANASAEARSRFKTATDAVAGIPFGQPILVGHHSEKRHRGAIAKMERNMDKMCEATDRAAELSRRAEAVGTGGISSDDPEAIEKLADKRTELEVRRDWMKAINAHFRKHTNYEVPGAPAELVAAGKRTLELLPYHKVPFPSYALTNIGARIRDAAKRAARIEAVRTIPASEEALGADFLVIADPDRNRVLIKVGHRLSAEHYKLVRRAGFVWARSIPAFSRKLSEGALMLARATVERILKEETTA